MAENMKPASHTTRGTVLPSTTWKETEMVIWKCFPISMDWKIRSGISPLLCFVLFGFVVVDVRVTDVDSCNQNGETRKSTPGLVHHLSLPKNSSAEMAEVEKFLQFQQDTVPCQIRAKRGCATHPRSIAERVKFFSIQLDWTHSFHHYVRAYHLYEVLGTHNIWSINIWFSNSQMRRTRISEKMKKLQDLFPNMDKVYTSSTPKCISYTIHLD